MVRNGAGLEADMLDRIMRDNPERIIAPLKDTGWGHYIVPGPAENPYKTDNGLRLLVIGSWTLGMLAFEAAIEMEKRAPDSVNIIGLVTDDPLDPDARISVQKRFWHYYTQTRQEMYTLDIIEAALEFGVPCYTGEIKSNVFRSQLDRWNPDAIIVSAFGQRINAPVIEAPDYGIYNVHPADLLHGFGAGPQPWEDLVERQAETTRVTIHAVNEEIDAGAVVGQSPPLSVRLENGDCTNDICLIGEKTLVPVKHMVRELILRLCDEKASERKGPLDFIDFEASFSHQDRAVLMHPIVPGQRGHILPLSSRHTRDTV